MVLSVSEKRVSTLLDIRVTSSIYPDMFKALDTLGFKQKKLAFFIIVM